MEIAASETASTGFDFAYKDGLAPLESACPPVGASACVMVGTLDDHLALAFAEPVDVADSAAVAGVQFGDPYAAPAAAYVGGQGVAAGVAAAPAWPERVADVLDFELTFAGPVAEQEPEAGLVEGMEALGKVACVGHHLRAPSASELHSHLVCRL